MFGSSSSRSHGSGHATPMKTFLHCLLLVLVPLVLHGCSDATNPGEETEPPGIVLVIGDGMGDGALAVSRRAGGPLVMETLPVRRTVTTETVTGRITDSGAAATALATGVATYYRAIGVGPDSLPRLTVLEAAETAGMATGLVVTSPMTHATPAAFAAHVPDRSMVEEIAEQMEASGVDVLLGGGRLDFVPEGRGDGVDLLDRFRERACTVVEDRAALVAVDPSETPCLVGLFATGGLPPAGIRVPSLPLMAERALDVLLRDREGFFLMVEGSQIDWAGHAHDGEWSIRETLDLDRTVATLLDRLADRPNTLVLVTADHETGGLRPGLDGEEAFVWDAPDHTADPVPLFGSASASDLPADTLTSAEVGTYLMGRLPR